MATMRSRFQPPWDGLYPQQSNSNPTSRRLRGALAPDFHFHFAAFADGPPRTVRKLERCGVQRAPNLHGIGTKGKPSGGANAKP
jgi:hypothetical protein